jgi:DNA polymerase III delta subunit
VSVEKSLVEESLAFTTPMFASEQTVVGTAKKKYNQEHNKLLHLTISPPNEVIVIDEAVFMSSAALPCPFIMC